MRTLSDENKELRETISKYEDLLEKVLGGPKVIGVVDSKVFKGVCRVIVEERATISPIGETKIIDKIKPGTRVMVTKEGIISDLLPDELMPRKAPVKFNFIKWEQIGGLKSQVEKIRETISLPVQHPDLFKEYGITPSKGIVLYGPAGCGKTMVAKAIASDLLEGTELDQDSFIYLKGGEMLSPYVGMAENAIKQVFERSRRHFEKTGKRTVIFIDEAEAILPARGSRRSSDVETTIVPTFLSEMDGFEANSTFIILATNFLGQLDDAVIRPGRIDLSVEIARPKEDDVKDILTLYLNKSRVKGSVEDLVNEFMPILTEEHLMRQMSGAFIKNIVDKAAALAVKDVVKPAQGVKERMVKAITNHGITIEHLKQALTY